MKFSRMTSAKSLILMGLLSASCTTYAFDYGKAVTNFVDNTTQKTGDLFSKGYYLGGSMGQSEASSYCSGSSNCEDSDSAWKLFGGYKLLEKVSVEGAYLNLGDIRKDGQNSDVSAYGGYGVGTLSVTEKIDAFAKLGGVYWQSENTEGKKDGFGLAYGLGAKMIMNETTKLRAEWEKLSGIKTSDTEETDINILTLGVEFETF